MKNSTKLEMDCSIESMNCLMKETKKILLSVKSGEPNWKLFNYPEAANLPAIQWKLQNIYHIQSKTKEPAFSKLEKVLIGGPTRL